MPASPQEPRRIFPQLEATPDIGHGHARFAAEVALAELRGIKVPLFASLKAHEVLNVLARG